MTEKNKKGGSKFMLGAVLGGLIGVVAGKFYKTNEKEIKEGVGKKVGEIKDKFSCAKDDIEDEAEDIKEEIEEDIHEIKEKASKSTKK